MARAVRARDPSLLAGQREPAVWLPIAQWRRRSKGLATLDTPPRFDLLIVDEAHNARNTDTNLHQGLRLLADNAEAVVLLTATPVQLGTGDLFSLLNLLRPDLVIDRPTFERMAEPNGAINAAVAAIRGGQPGWQAEALDHLVEAAATDWGRVMLGPSPEFRALVAAIRETRDDEGRVRLIHRSRGASQLRLAHQPHAPPRHWRLYNAQAAN